MRTAIPLAPEVAEPMERVLLAHDFGFNLADVFSRKCCKESDYGNEDSHRHGATNATAIKSFMTRPFAPERNMGQLKSEQLGITPAKREARRLQRYWNLPSSSLIRGYIGAPM